MTSNSINTVEEVIYPEEKTGAANPGTYSDSALSKDGSRVSEGVKANNEGRDLKA